MRSFTTPGHALENGGAATYSAPRGVVSQLAFPALARQWTIILSCLLLAFCTFGCEQEISHHDTGELTIAFLSNEQSDNRSIEPDGESPLDLVAFSVSGIGPENQILEKTNSSNPTITIGSLKLGSWTFTGTGYNSMGKAISQGATNARITGNNNVVTIALESAVGSGSFSLSCNWDPEQTRTDSVVSMQLLDSDNNVIPQLNLSTDLVAGTAILSGTDIPSGYYTAMVTIETDGELVGGFVESVRIIDGTLSSAVCNLEIGHVADSATITIIDNTAAPVNGSIIATPMDLVVGESAILTFSLDEGQDIAIGDLSIQWYCDGVPIPGATGVSYTIDSLNGGAFRYDIVVGLPQTGSIGSAGIRLDVPVEPHLVNQYQ
jgi:hypothetical protein